MLLGIFFDDVDLDQKKFKFTMSIGTDIRLTAASNFPSQGIRQMEQFTKLSNSLRKRFID
jgi:hypothetical protein